MIERPEPTDEAPQNLCLDKGYDYLPVRELVDELGFVAHIRARGEERELKRADPDWRARRWVVERTNAWLNRYRGLLIRWSKKPENHMAMMQLACGLIAWKAAQPGGLSG